MDYRLIAILFVAGLIVWGQSFAVIYPGYEYDPDYQRIGGWEKLGRSWEIGYRQATDGETYHYYDFACTDDLCVYATCGQQFGDYGPPDDGYNTCPWFTLSRGETYTRRFANVQGKVLWKVSYRHVVPSPTTTLPMPPAPEPATLRDMLERIFTQIWDSIRRALGWL